MSYCHNCKKLVDTDKEWQRIDNDHIRIKYYCDRCGCYLEGEDDIQKSKIQDWEK